MKNIAVTGAGGFVGKNLLKRANGDLHFFALDLRALMAGNETPAVKPDHVIHLAAKTFVPDSWKNPAEFYQVNVMGTQAVLDYCRQQQCGLTYISSYVYGVPEHLPIDETHAVAPNTPYNHSKLMGEELCAFYHRAFNIDVAVIRPFNIYGPAQNGTFLIPTIVDQIVNGNGDVQLQSLSPKRDYLYIDDFLDALVATIGFKGFDTFNLGAGYSVSVKEVAELLLQLSHQQKQITSTGVERANEVLDVVANAHKFKARFNWEPKTSMAAGLQQVLEQALKTQKA